MSDKPLRDIVAIHRMTGSGATAMQWSGSAATIVRQVDPGVWYAAELACGHTSNIIGNPPSKPDKKRCPHCIVLPCGHWDDLAIREPNKQRDALTVHCSHHCQSSQQSSASALSARKVRVMGKDDTTTKAVTKYDAAVLKARQKQINDLMKSGTMDAATAGIAEAADPERLAQLLASGEMVIADQILTLKQGQVLRGICLSTGTTEVASVERPGEMSTVPTWTIEHASGTRVSILGAAMLNRQLKGCLGCEVEIYRGPEMPGRNGRKVTQYLVARGKQVYTADEAKYLVASGETVTVDAQ